MSYKKSLKTLLKENRDVITTGCIFYAFSTQTSDGNDGVQIPITMLTNEHLNKVLAENDWWIEDGDFCIRNEVLW